MSAALQGGPSRPSLVPVPAIARRKAYRIERPLGPIDLKLDGNEGPAPPASLLARVELNCETLRRYPSSARLEAMIAARHGITPDQVLVTAGADDGLDRACRALLCPGRQLLLPEPTFEMIRRYAEPTGGEVVSVPWPTPAYPLQAVLAALSDSTAAIAVVSPNNPTGAVATRDQLRRLSERASHAAILLDHAYVELADEDLTADALSLPNVLVFRTLSKAWGMAGLRIGYVMGPAPMVDWLRRSGHPYPVSAASLAFAEAQYGREEGVVAYRQQVRRERQVMREQLVEAGVDARPSQANFVYCQGPRARWLRDGMASLGVAVRGWSSGMLRDAVRMTCPGDEEALKRVCHALTSTLSPEALLFDMDGVLVDVSSSYREAIVQTARSYSVELTQQDIANAKASGDCNNDWKLTQRLLSERAVEAPLDEVTRRFEEHYQGTAAAPGLHTRETPLVTRQWLERLAKRLPMAIVTGRPRADALRYLEREQISHCFSAVVCMEDAPLKPNPEPVRRALRELGVTRAWMIGDTPDDIRAAAAAGVVSIGVSAEGDGSAEGTASCALLRAGASRVLTTARQLEELL